MQADVLWKFASFEYVALQLNLSSQAVFLNIYRPPKYCAHFFDDFAELLSVICIILTV